MVNWNNQEEAVKALKSVYPDTNEYFLLMSWNMWKNTKKLSKKQKDKIIKNINKSSPEEYQEIEKEINSISII